jgi:hypothetical protein
MPNMVMGWVGDLLVAVHSTSTPTDVEWRAYLDISTQQKAARASGVRPKQLIVTAGGAPSLEQRRQAHAAAGNADIPVAVVTASGFARFVVNMLVSKRTNEACRAFAPHEMEEVYRFLEVEAGDREAIEQCITALEASLARGERTKRRSFWESRRPSGARVK